MGRLSTNPTSITIKRTSTILTATTSPRYLRPMRMGCIRTGSWTWPRTSREALWWCLRGFIPQANVIGRPMFIYWSFDTPADQYMKTGIWERLGFLAHVVLHFFDET